MTGEAAVGLGVLVPPVPVAVVVHLPPVAVVVHLPPKRGHLGDEALDALVVGVWRRDCLGPFSQP